MSSQLKLFETTNHNCRNCTACFFETNCQNGKVVNRIICIHGIVDTFIGSETNYFTDCQRYSELYDAKILGIPLSF